MAVTEATVSNGDAAKLFVPLSRPGQPTPAFSDPTVVDEGAWGMDLAPLAVVLEQLVMQVTQCSMSEQWELQRMADQVWEPLVQVLLWLDEGLLLQRMWAVYLPTSSSVLQCVGVLSLKHTLKVVLGWKSGHLDESKRMALEEVATARLDAAALARIQRSTCEAASALLKLGLSRQCERTTSLVAEVLVLMCCQYPGDIATADVPTFVDFVVQRFVHLRQLATSTPDNGGETALRVERWLLTATCRSLPALARLCSEPQRRPLLWLLCDHARRRQEPMLLASLTEAIGDLPSYSTPVAATPSLTTTSPAVLTFAEFQGCSIATTLLHTVDTLVHVVRGSEDVSRRKLGIAALGQVSTRCAETNAMMPASLLRKVLLVLADGILRDHDGRVPTTPTAGLAVINPDSVESGDKEVEGGGEAAGDGDWSDWDEDEEEEDEVGASGDSAAPELSEVLLRLSSMRFGVDGDQAWGSAKASIESSSHLSFQEVLAETSEPHQSCIKWALL
jgi:hypothetical protein